MTTNAPRNYLNNKDILLEIHRSKSSYCSFLDPTFHQYDIILAGLDKINVRTIAQAKRNQAKRLGDIDYNTKKLAGEKIKQSEKFDQMQNLFLKVHPGGTWQERVFNFSVFYADFGKQWIADSYQLMDVQKSELIISSI